MSRTSFSKYARNLRKYAWNLHRTMAQSHMNDSHHQSRHTHERDMSRTSCSKNARNLRRAMAQSALKAPHGLDESSVRRHVTCMKESCHVRMRHVTYGRVTSHIGMSHVKWTRRVIWETSCHTYEWVMSYMDKSHHTWEWVMSHTNESCHVQISHVTSGRVICETSCHTYGVATISRLLKMIGIFCRILSLLWVSFATETYHFKEPTNRSHPIWMIQVRQEW